MNKTFFIFTFFLISIHLCTAKADNALDCKNRLYNETQTYLNKVNLRIYDSIVVKQLISEAIQYSKYHLCSEEDLTALAKKDKAFRTLRFNAVGKVVSVELSPTKLVTPTDVMNYAIFFDNQAHPISLTTPLTKASFENRSEKWPFKAKCSPHSVWRNTDDNAKVNIAGRKIRNQNSTNTEYFINFDGAKAGDLPGVIIEEGSPSTDNTIVDITQLTALGAIGFGAYTSIAAKVGGTIGTGFAPGVGTLIGAGAGLVVGGAIAGLGYLVGPKHVLNYQTLGAAIADANAFVRELNGTECAGLYVHVIVAGKGGSFVIYKAGRILETSAPLSDY